MRSGSTPFALFLSCFVCVWISISLQSLHGNYSIWEHNLLLCSVTSLHRIKFKSPINWTLWKMASSRASKNLPQTHDSHNIQTVTTIEMSLLSLLWWFFRFYSLGLNSYVCAAIKLYGINLFGDSAWCNLWIRILWRNAHENVFHSISFYLSLHHIIRHTHAQHTNKYQSHDYFISFFIVSSVERYVYDQCCDFEKISHSHIANKKYAQPSWMPICIP